MGAAAYVAGMNATRASLFVLGLALGSFTLAGCGDSSSGNPPSDGGVGGSGGGSGGSGGGFGGKLDKLDLLLMVDNSPAMGDKQQLLADAVPSLVQRLVTPRCLNDGDLPTGDSFPCPAGAHPEISPIQDIHIGVVTSSLGGHGGNACENGLEGQNDHAHLLPFFQIGSLQLRPVNSDKVAGNGCKNPQAIKACRLELQLLVDGMAFFLLDLHG